MGFPAAKLSHLILGWLSVHFVPSLFTQLLRVEVFFFFFFDFVFFWQNAHNCQIGNLLFFERIKIKSTRKLWGFILYLTCKNIVLLDGLINWSKSFVLSTELPKLVFLNFGWIYIMFPSGIVLCSLSANRLYEGVGKNGDHL